MQLTITDVWKMFCELVENYPTQTSDYLQPQTFAVMREPANVGGDFAKDYKYYYEATNRDLFYSRAWQSASFPKNIIKAEFPAVVAFNNSLDAVIDQLPLYTIDVYIADIEHSNATDVRKWEQIDEDIETILLSLIKELKSYVFATTNIDTTGSWYAINKLEALKAATVITSYTIEGYMSTKLKTRTLQLERGYKQGKNSLQTIGTTIQIQGCNTNLQTYSY